MVMEKNISVTKVKNVRKMYLKEIEKAKIALLSSKTPREIRALQARIKYLEDLLRKTSEE
ncbi:MAG: hypothetical protein QXT34_00905 [Candidatus Aenigmatarchaeota archaeon]